MIFSWCLESQQVFCAFCVGWQEGCSVCVKPVKKSHTKWDERKDGRHIPKQRKRKSNHWQLIQDIAGQDYQQNKPVCIKEILFFSLGINHQSDMYFNKVPLQIMHIIGVFFSLSDCEQPENGLNLVETCSCNYGFYDKSLLENVYTGPLLSRDCCVHLHQTYWCILVLKSFKKDLVSACTCKSISCSFVCSEGVCGSRGIDPLILNHDTRWRWVVGFMPQVLYLHGKHTAHWIGG